MDKQISIARREVLSRDPTDQDNIAPDVLPKVDESTPITARLYVSTLSTDGCSVREPTVASPTIHSHPGFNPPIMPSDYLRSRCPLCFGGFNVVGESKL
jgi:hypothetical protein